MPFDVAGNAVNAKVDSPPLRKPFYWFSREMVLLNLSAGKRWSRVCLNSSPLRPSRTCQGRDVSDDALKRLAQQVEETVRSSGSSQIRANDIGLAILDPLRELDEVAYLRFASVYKSFEDADDFEKEIRLMRRRKDED